LDARTLQTSTFTWCWTEARRGAGVAGAEGHHPTLWVQLCHQQMRGADLTDDHRNGQDGRVIRMGIQIT